MYLFGGKLEFCTHRGGEKERERETETGTETETKKDIFHFLAHCSKCLLEPGTWNFT